MKYSSMVVFLTSIILVGCNAITVRGSGTPYETVHSVDDVRVVEVNGSGELRIQNGNRNELIVLAQDEIHQHLNIRQRGDRLIIEPHEGYTFRTESTLRYLLITDDINNIVISGAVSATSEDYRTESLFIDASGATDLDMTLHADSLTVDASGAFDGYLGGDVRTLTLDFSGSSDLNAYDLTADSVDIDLTGAGTLYVNARDRLNVSAAGASQVTYKGNPQVSQSAAGASSVSSAE